MLTDSFGRVLDYLRVSVTDRCSLRCVYCMPPEGVEWKPHDSILSFEEIIRLVKIMASLGVRRVKVTGGEPLLRKGVSSLPGNLKNIHGIEKVTLTTNGLLLGKYLDDLQEQNSLPDGINISLDALDAERYKHITRCENAAPEEILSSVDRLLEKQVAVKINCVPVRGINEEEIMPIAALAKDRNVIVRFIELMPIGSAASFKTVSGDEAKAVIEKEFGILTPFDGLKGSGPAVYYSLRGFAGKIGFINAVSRNFCKTCNRLRLTSEGFLKLCLSNDTGINLRELLRTGASDNDLACVITEAAANKPQSYNFSDHHEGMSKVGG